jgi:hypothetical protein
MKEGRAKERKERKGDKERKRKKKEKKRKGKKVTSKEYCGNHKTFLSITSGFSQPCNV